MNLIAFLAFSIFFHFFSSAFAGEDLPSVKSGYQDGFYVATTDDRFRLKVGSRLNFGYRYGFVSPDSDFSSFDLLHAKLYAGGNAFGPYVQFYLQAGAAAHSQGALSATAESNEGAFTLEDYYVRLVHQPLSLKVGQYKVPFGRQWMIYSGNFEFADRSLVTKAFTFGRDRGVTLNGDWTTFSYTLGIFNGGGTPAEGSGFQPASFETTGQNSSNDTLGGGQGHLYVARLVAMPFGSSGYSEGDVESSEGHHLDIGAGFLFDHDRDVDVNGDGVVDDTEADLTNLSGEFVWKSEGKSLQGEFFFRHMNGSLFPDTNSIGFYLQPGYFILPGKLELAGRFGWVDPDLDSSDDRFFETAFSANYYLSSDHRYKAQLQYSWRSQETPLSGRNDDGFIDFVLQLTI